MRILLLTSCTGEKKFTPPNQLKAEDFLDLHVPEKFKPIEDELGDYRLPAEEMYTGQQHLRLMKAVKEIREGKGNIFIDLWIVSAGYGIILGDKQIVPYECTFQGMKAKDISLWGEHLRIPGDVRKVLEKPFDLGMVLLGESYLKACSLDQNVVLGGPTLFFCSSSAAGKFPAIANSRTIALTNQDTKRFSCGLVGLKGEIAARLLTKFCSDAAQVSQLPGSNTDLLTSLENGQQVAGKSRSSLSRLFDVDRVIDLPDSWWQKTHREKIRYFIPEWDDLVDPEYDFETDTHSGGRGDWSNEVFAHQLYPEPNYDGILVSRSVIDKHKGKKERIQGIGGIHRWLRVPAEFPIMGDCGAFGYIMEETPPYTTDQVLDYYTSLGLDYGVSVDHLIVKGTMHEKDARYQLTIQNAEDFLLEHRKRGLEWEPVGAIQGWDPTSYADAARRYVGMGYRYIALGGLVRSSTPDILKVLDKVQEVVPPDVKVHLFGLARYRAVQEFVNKGVYSIDSASVLRQAWMGNTRNYLSRDGWYPAVRIPQVPKEGKRSFRAKQVIDSGIRSLDELRRLEQSCLRGLREYGNGNIRLSQSLLNELVEYDTLIAGERKGTQDRIQRTLEDRPWEKCGCAICARWGIEVVIFRGNNRNRRRGFHNTYVFYQLLDRILSGEKISWIDNGAEGNEANVQLTLFSQR